MTERLSVSLRKAGVRRGGRWALRDITLNLEAGERWALIGGNGSGKTQLLKLISGDVWPTPASRATRLHRDVRAYQEGARALDLASAKQRIAYVGAELQDKYARYGWNLSGFDTLATGLHRTELLLQPVRPEEGRRVRTLLKLCGIAHLEKRRFLSLSYGQKRLVLLARALVQKPDWLLLDEFYNGLDTDFRRRIDAILERARRAGQSWIAAAHRAADVPRGTSGVLELRAGFLVGVQRLRNADLLRLAADADEVRRRGSRPRNASHAAPRPGPRHGGRGADVQHPVARRAKVRRGVRSGQVLIDIVNANLYVDYRAVLREVTWRLRDGEHWAVFGANGAGKSSFLKLLYGDLSPALGGRIERRGFPRGTPIEDWKRQIGFVSPELQADYTLNTSVRDLVASGRHASIGLCDAPTSADLKAARHWLKFFALKAVAQRRPLELSYGQMRRALFARALAAEPRILLLDEPLTGLDPRQRALMKRLLQRLMREGRTVIMAVHHPEDLPLGITHGLRLQGRRAEAAVLDLCHP